MVRRLDPFVHAPPRGADAGELPPVAATTDTRVAHALAPTDVFNRKRSMNVRTRVGKLTLVAPPGDSIAIGMIPSSDVTTALVVTPVDLVVYADAGDGVVQVGHQRITLPTVIPPAIPGERALCVVTYPGTRHWIVELEVPTDVFNDFELPLVYATSPYPCGPPGLVPINPEFADFREDRTIAVPVGGVATLPAWPYLVEVSGFSANNAPFADVFVMLFASASLVSAGAVDPVYVARVRAELNFSMSFAPPMRLKKELLWYAAASSNPGTLALVPGADIRLNVRGRYAP